MADAMSPDEIRDLNAYQLAQLADCQEPDRLHSDGAEYLLSVRGAVLETYAWEVVEGNGTWTTFKDQCRAGASEVLTVYTHPMFKVFLDLCAYQEELNDWGAWDSFESAARMALWQIGERLAGQLYQSLEAWHDTQEEEDDLAKDAVTV